MRKLIAALLVSVMLIGTALLPATVLAEEVPAGEYGVNYVKYGDVDANGQVNANDALKCLQYSVNKIQLDDVQKEVADVSGNDRIDAEDALMILKLNVGKLTVFAVGEYYVFNPVNTQPEPGPEPEPDPEPEPEPEPTPPNPAKTFAEYMTSYDKSNSVNGAYVNDPTADCSFSVDVSSLAPNTIYRVNASVYTQVDQGRLIFSLQGLINRDFGKDENHTSIVYCMGDSSDSEWLSQVTAEGTIMQQENAETGLIGMSIVRISTWDKFFEIFGPVIKSCGIILWDGNVPATANVAGTICGLDGFLPVLANSPLHKTLTAAGVKEKQSLVGLFANGKKGQAITGTGIASTGSAKNDAYLWALEKYFHRCSSTYMGYILDGAICIKGYTGVYADNPIAVIGGNHCLTNHDYLIARRAFFFDLAPYKGEAACDDPAQSNGQASIGVDNQTMLKIYQARYDRANGAFGQLLGFPPWWVKYCKDANGGSKDAPWIEWLFCEYITAYNMAKEADAQAPASMTNGSVYYKYIPEKSQYTNNYASQNISYDKDTFYYTIYVGDYDSSAWLKQHIYEMWIKGGGDKHRGSLPLMWSINPNLSDRVPMIFDYMFENRTDMDYIVGGDGGAGYVIPEALFQDKSLAYMGEKRPAANGNGGGIFAAYSKKYYDRFGMEMTGFIINGGQHAITANIADCFSRFSPKLNFTNCFDTRVARYKDTYFVYCQNGISASPPSDGGSWYYDTMYNHAQTTRSSGYNFSAFRTVCEQPKDINAIVTKFDSYASGKGMKVKYVDPYTYYNLLKASGQGINLGTASAPSNPTTPTPDPYIPPDPDVLVPFDSTAGISTAFSTTAAIETNNKKEGSGALRMGFEKPTAQAGTNQIGGMAYYEFDAPVDLSAIKGFTMDYWLTDAVSGSAGLQINFVTNGKEDGYNFMVGIDNAQPGWHTVSLDKSKPSATANNPNWSSIRAIRITYFNYANNPKPNFILVDNLKALGGSTTPADPSVPSEPSTPSTGSKALITFDSTAGFTTAFSTTVSADASNKKEGTGSLRADFAKPTGEAATTQIGGMVYYEFGSAVNLSSSTTFTLDYWLPKAISGKAGLQVNFVTNGKDDGYNFTVAIDNAAAGWHTIKIDKSKPSATSNNPNWSSIRGVRITYFNYANNTEPAYMLFDNLTADGNVSTPSTPSNPSTGTKVLLNFDSTGGFTTAFSTAASVETANKKEGTGSLRADFTKPTGESASTKIGGMVFYEFSSAVDLSSATTFTLDYWIPKAINGKAGLQVNFVTNGKDDGYNFTVAIDNAAAGWHTIKMDKSKPTATANNPNWNSIRAIRITYFNTADNTEPAFMLLDNLTVDGNVTVPAAPSAKEDVVVSFDSTAGFTSAFSTSLAAETANKKEGSGALRASFGKPTGESASTKIGGMVYYEFNTALDLSSAKSFTLDYWVPETVSGSAGIQINFVTNGKDDGYNFMMGINDSTAGWHTLTLDKSKPSATSNNPNWSSIRAIRITYFNYANNEKPNYMLLDNLKAIS